jgi:hypothetical protein
LSGHFLYSRHGFGEEGNLHMTLTRSATIVGAIAAAGLALSGLAATATPALPKFEPDATWPKHLPNHWLLGQVAGVNVDSRDHIWVR